MVDISLSLTETTILVFDKQSCVSVVFVFI